jgi:hypothetical protein
VAGTEKSELPSRQRQKTWRAVAWPAMSPFFRRPPGIFLGIGERPAPPEFEWRTAAVALDIHLRMAAVMNKAVGGSDCNCLVRQDPPEFV